MERQRFPSWRRARGQAAALLCELQHDIRVRGHPQPHQRPPPEQLLGNPHSWGRLSPHSFNRQLSSSTMFTITMSHRSQVIHIYISQNYHFLFLFCTTNSGSHRVAAIQVKPVLLLKASVCQAEIQRCKYFPGAVIF